MIARQRSQMSPSLMLAGQSGGGGAGNWLAGRMADPEAAAVEGLQVAIFNDMRLPSGLLGAKVILRVAREPEDATNREEES